VVQGRLAVEMAVRAIEGKLTVAHAGPRIEIVTADSVKSIGTEGSLAPASFVPIFAMASGDVAAP
jgi:protein TorT